MSTLLTTCVDADEIPGNRNRVDGDAVDSGKFLAMGGTTLELDMMRDVIGLVVLFGIDLRADSVLFIGDLRVKVAMYI